MRLALTLHPDSHCDAVSSIAVDVTRPSQETLALRYIVHGTIADVLLAPMSAPTRTDELWQHTCFEVFIADANAPSYAEFNFAPSTQWAAYRFDRFREGMANAPIDRAPSVETNVAPEQFELRATAPISSEHGARLALSVVIEETNGVKSYWALAHPPGKADFHHPQSFAYELPHAEHS